MKEAVNLSREHQTALEQPQDIEELQETIFRFFLDLVRHFPPADALQEFCRIFFEYESSPSNIQVFRAVTALIYHDNKSQFLNTFKRCCYILINNWESNRSFEAIQDLIDIFEFTNFEEAQSRTSRLTHRYNSPSAKITRRLNSWVQEFKNGQDYQDLQLFIAKVDPQLKHHHESLLHKHADEQNRPLRKARIESKSLHWSKRYTSYLLVPQYINTQNSPEQREAARQLSHELKQQFKFDLAMYTALSQSEAARQDLPDNPTGLGEEAVRLIKKIVAKRGRFSYSNLAHIFLKQIEGLYYQEFKDALKNYLIGYTDDQGDSQKPELGSFQHKVSECIDNIYPDYEEEIVNDPLLLRTCNRLVDDLTTTDQNTPSELFARFLSQGHPLTLVIVLLKLILICPAARMHLDHQIACLIRYYMQFPEDECQWAVQFFEIFNITFAIYADKDVKYDLIRRSSNNKSANADQDNQWDDYCIFSQYKGESSRKNQQATKNQS